MLLIMLLLIWTALYVPYRLAFIDNPSIAIFSMEITMDAIFLLDIIINFNSAFYDENNLLIVDRKLIATRYLKSWFAIDLLSRLYIYIYIYVYSLPVQLFDSSLKMNKAMRLLRLPRIYRMFKVVKLVKMFNLMKPSKVYEKLMFLIRLHSGNYLF